MQERLIAHAAEVFERRFGGTKPVGVAIAPGRVNLIGEHTDYNDGFVLPMAIGRYVAIAFRPTFSSDVRVWSDHFAEELQFKTTDLKPGALGGWGAYAAGMYWAMRERGLAVLGMDAVVTANIPIGAGVSSSAALEVSFGSAVSASSGLALDPMEIAQISHEADNGFVGIPSGIMDQFASALCRRGHALLIDCRSKMSESVPIPEDVCFVVMDTGKRRGLVDSAYAERVAACRRVAAAVRAIRPDVLALRDVDTNDLEAVRSSIQETDYFRARHVIAENGRTVQAVGYLRSGDATSFGRLMTASHASLRDLYEVSCDELDIAVEIALDDPACLGARMTGGGFGGCALAMVKTVHKDDFIEHATAKYAAQTSLSGAFFAVEPADGVRLLKM